MRTFLAAFAVMALASAMLHGREAAAQNPDDRLLEGVNQAVVMPPEIGSNPANRDCGVTTGLVEDAIVSGVLRSGLRTERFEVATPFTVNTPGVYLVPTVATLREGPYMCISWVGLRAQSAQPVTLPSTGLFKTVQVIHWDRGYLLSDNASRHPATITDAFARLAAEFGEQWRRDQR